jgi:hypothetical protein
MIVYPSRRSALWLAVLLAISPVTLDVSGSGRVVRLQQACGQAKDCEQSSAFICSKADGDKVGYKCSKGCEPVVQQ